HTQAHWISDDNLHTMYTDVCGNAVLADTYRRMVSRLHLFRARGLVMGGGFERSNTEHRKIVSALDARNAQAAFDAGVEHVQNGKVRIVLSDLEPD
ncbi:MAG: FCD domain-containing protein, partial [Pseudomonadota bacterium]